MNAPTPNPLSPSAAQTRAALDDLDDLHRAFSAVADLTIPDNSMGTVNRDNMAALLILMLRLQSEATQRAWEGFQAMREREAEGSKLAALAERFDALLRKGADAPAGGA